MEYPHPDGPNLAGGVVLVLVVVFIAACGASTPLSEPPEVAVTTDPTHPPASTGTPPPATSTPVATTTVTATARPTSAPEASPPAGVPAPELPALSRPEKSTPTGIEVYKTTITLPTYPIWDYLTGQIDPLYNTPAYYFDRPSFEADAPGPVPVDYTGVVLENAYLRLTFLPELGGRLYSAVVKRTGQEIFYHNLVVKPSRYGGLQPAEANWWLATGGMEWAYPTSEHGYRWGVPWDYRVSQSAASATITLSDTGPDRVGMAVQVTLPRNSAAFTVVPKLINNRPESVPVQVWLNAALTLAPNSMSRKTQFIVPVDRMIVHSRGEAEWSVPDAGQEAPWPLVGETDLSDYSQWANYLGFFVPNIEAPFMGAYNPETDLGVVRLVEPGMVPGSKLFAFGSTFPARDYTDDGSQYFEIWGGANTGFWSKDYVSVSGGGTLQWQEVWWPLAGLGGITWANRQAAIHLDQSDDSHKLSVLVSRPEQGQLIVMAGKTPILTESFTADPARPQRWQFIAPDEPVRVQLMDDNGSILLDSGFTISK